MTYFYGKIQIDCKYEVKMKSLLTSFIMFAVVCAALYSGVFNFMASPYMLAFAAVSVIVALVFAVRILGNPLANKDTKDDKHNKK